MRLSSRIAKYNSVIQRKSVKCRQVRAASECVRRSHCAARHTPTQNAPVWRSGRLNPHRPSRHDRTSLPVSCLAWRCELALTGRRSNSRTTEMSTAGCYTRVRALTSHTVYALHRRRVHSIHDINSRPASPVRLLQALNPRIHAAV